MDVVLQQINKIQGVVGSFVCDEDGKLLGHALPSKYSADSLQETASLLAENLIGIDAVTGNINGLDLRFTDCRLLVRSMQGSYLMLMCEQKINYQLLTMSLTVAQRKLEKEIQIYKSQSANRLLQSAVSVAPPAVACEPRMEGNGLIFVIDSMASSSVIKWDQMKEEVSISDLQARYLKKISVGSPVKKLKLTNKTKQISKVFNIRTCESKPGQLMDDKIILTMAALDALEAKPGDLITVESAARSIFEDNLVYAGL